MAFTRMTTTGPSGFGQIIMSLCVLVNNIIKEGNRRFSVLHPISFPGPSGFQPSVLVQELDYLLGCLEQYLHYFHVHVIGFLSYPTELFPRTGLRAYTGFFSFSTFIKVVRLDAA